MYSWIQTVRYDCVLHFQTYFASFCLWFFAKMTPRLPAVESFLCFFFFSGFVFVSFDSSDSLFKMSSTFLASGCWSMRTTLRPRATFPR